MIQSYMTLYEDAFCVKLSYVFYHDCVYDNAILRGKKMFAPFFGSSRIALQRKLDLLRHSTGLIDAIILFVMGMISPKLIPHCYSSLPLYQAPQKSPSIRYRVYMF